MQTSYVIFTDSTGDLTPALIEQCELQVMPMAFNLDGADYRNYPDGREMSPHEFYEKLRGGSLCKTSQIPISEFVDAFTPVLEQGLDILYLAFSSGLSGTFQSSRLAVEELKEKYPARRMICVDSLQASMGEGLFAYLVAQKRLQGAALDEAARYASDLAPSVCAWFTVDDLMFLKRGGRVSGAVAVAGTLLGIKPVLHVDDEGHLIAMEKVRGRRASLDALVRHFEQTALDNNLLNSASILSQVPLLQDALQGELPLDELADYLDDTIRQTSDIDLILVGDTDSILFQQKFPDPHTLPPLSYACAGSDPPTFRNEYSPAESIPVQSFSPRKYHFCVRIIPAHGLPQRKERRRGDHHHYNSQHEKHRQQQFRRRLLSLPHRQILSLAERIFHFRLQMPPHLPPSHAYAAFQQRDQPDITS